MTDEKRILAIETWATMHSTQKETIPAIGLKYINDLLEYIEDMDLLKAQGELQQIRDRMYAEIEKEYHLLEKRADVEALEQKIVDHFHEKVTTEEGLCPYIVDLPITFILKILFRKIWR